jgi:hypothetical protein
VTNKVTTKARGGTYGVTLAQNIRSCGNNCPPYLIKKDGAKGWLVKIPRLVKLKFRERTYTRYFIRLMLQSAYIKENSICCTRSKHSSI